MYEILNKLTARINARRKSKQRRHARLIVEFVTRVKELPENEALPLTKETIAACVNWAVKQYRDPLAFDSELFDLAKIRACYSVCRNRMTSAAYCAQYADSPKRCLELYIKSVFYPQPYKETRETFVGDNDRNIGAALEWLRPGLAYVVIIID